MFEKMKICQIKELVESTAQEDELSLIFQLRQDSREGVRKLAEVLWNKREAQSKERHRIEGMKEMERAWRQKGYAFVAGMDEVGRGPLAGPVVAACVLMEADVQIQGVKDSKKLTEEKREALYEEILSKAQAVGIGSAGNDEIDRLNILQATFLAMRRGVAQMEVQPDLILVDGNQKVKGLRTPHETVVKGDSISFLIACASIVAKVTRDRQMRMYHALYPEYDFESNKGYGTAKHYAALAAYGVTPIHRKTFLG